MDPDVSTRLTDQRLRNRIMEALEILAAGDDGVRSVGAVGYFEWFYDVLPYRDRGVQLSNSAITGTERDVLAALGQLVDDACDATPPLVAEADLIASGGPDRIGPVAQAALAMMRQRGWFSEEVEEQVPTRPA